MITDKEVKQLAESFWNDVRSGRPGSEMEHFFIGQGHVMLPEGTFMDLESHQQMHRRLCDETHTWNALEVTQVCEDPEKAHVSGVVQWDASFADGRPGQIESHVHEEWIVERCKDGQIRFVFYRSSAVDFSTNSSSLDI